MRKSILVTVFCVLTACSSAPPLSPWETPPSAASVDGRSVRVMGADFHVRIWKDKSLAADRAKGLAAAVAEIKRIAFMADSKNPRGEVSIVNARADRESVKISTELYTLLRLGQQMNARSGGIFDVTFAPIQQVTEKHGANTGLESGVNEAANEVDVTLKTRVGGRLITLTPPGPPGAKGAPGSPALIHFTEPGVKIGVLGLARGYAVQKAAEKLTPFGFSGFAVLGGGVLAASGKALADDHLMCVEHPNQLGTCAFRILPKTITPIAYFAASAIGDRPGHIYDAKNGMRKARSGGVTVAASDGASAQAAAVSVAAMDNKETLSFFQNGLPPLLNGVFFENDFSITLFGSLEPFARTVPVPKPEATD